ncbi:MAG: hypothetical protein ABDH18_01655 [Aquificaceae bacterium]
MQNLNLLISQVAKTIGFSEPDRISLSYQLGELCIDIFLTKEQNAWEINNFGLSVPIKKIQELKDLLDAIGLDPEAIYCEEDRAYTSFSEEDWELANSLITTLL